MKEDRRCCVINTAELPTTPKYIRSSYRQSNLKAAYCTQARKGSQAVSALSPQDPSFVCPQRFRPRNLGCPAQEEGIKQATLAARLSLSHADERVSEKWLNLGISLADWVERKPQSDSPEGAGIVKSLVK